MEATVTEDSSHLSFPTMRTATKVNGFSVLKLKSEKSILGFFCTILVTLLR